MSESSKLHESPKYFFPEEITYSDKVVALADIDELSKSVKSMITLLSKRDDISNELKELFDGFKKDDDVEDVVLKRIENYNPGDDLQEIFHLIQVWGGMAGRGIYIFNGGFNWSKIREPYEELINCCLDVKDIELESLNRIIYAIDKFCKSVSNMNIAFITKHTRFWLRKTLKDNALPIYDRIMAVWVMRKSEPQIKDLAEYWKVMISKAESLSIGLVPLERHIFRYAYKLTNEK